MEDGGRQVNKLSLRDELGAQPDPEFEMELPRGWSRHAPDDATLQHMLDGVKRRLMEAHKPAMFAELKLMLERSFEDMRRNGVFAFFSAAEPGPGTLAIPASINASIRKAEPGTTLDDQVQILIRKHGATPLLGDKRTLRVESERSARVGTDTLIHHSVMYLTPVPGARRRRALQLVAGFARTPDTAPDDPALEATRLLFDSCAGTVRWRPHAESRRVRQ